MPSAAKSAPPSDRIRRRRVTTACTTCRDRRVKCDRARPMCSQCTKGEKICKYVDQDKAKVEFVNQQGNTITGPVEHPTLPSGTWDSIIDNQVDFVKTAEDEKKGVPVWALGEETSRPRMHGTAIHPKVIPIAALGESFVIALIDRFPSRETCQSFFDSFLLGIYPIVPVCHTPALRQQYDDFWINRSPSYSVESLTLILAVLYTGAANASHVDILNSSTILRLYKEIFGMLDFASYHSRNTSASIQLLQGYIIMSTYNASHLSPFSAFGFLPQVIRFAQSLRLHAETTHGDSIEIETGRRIWWHLLSFDIESTIATGLPTIIHGYTTHLPALNYDGVVNTHNGLITHPSDFCPMTIAMQGHYQWAHRMQIWFASLPSRDEVSNFKVVIESLLDLLPNNEILENEWARTYLKMQIDRAYCMLGLRFWQLDQYKGTGCDSEVVETARSFLTHYLKLSTFPTMTHFSWFIPGLIQPLHALIILLMHLSTCPNICDEERSRFLLDQTMSMRVDCILNGSVVAAKALLRGDCHPQRANPRYLILVELRKRVWKKVGWDVDGKGRDPWAGKLAKGEIVGGGEDEVVYGQNLEVEPRHEEAKLEERNGAWGAYETTGLEGLDNILAGDPMDLFQWDEWETLASDFFANPDIEVPSSQMMSNPSGTAEI